MCMFCRPYDFKNSVQIFQGKAINASYDQILSHFELKFSDSMRKTSLYQLASTLVLLGGLIAIILLIPGQTLKPRNQASVLCLIKISKIFQKSRILDQKLHSKRRLANFTDIIDKITKSNNIKSALKCHFDQEFVDFSEN